ncbi:YrhB domain-containing protein [Vibrio neptunius]|uniref:YrhB domain-containing protein n=1 Tax=Vibrio neptunius TaxID=170651 RepID=UPI0019D2AA8E|nr:YrhB domain-containing protein [Vibrio neptunius]MBN3573753.1 hypothetical protein [Vibrio neptunius]QXX09420.1 YrhB family protein [Vibrio neptunius]
MNFTEAVKKVESYLKGEEIKMNSFGSSLPNYVHPNIKLKIQDHDTEQYDFGWVFYYNTEKYIETGDFREALGGNAPLIVNKDTGDIVITGTAEDIGFYIKNYIKTGNPHKET